MTVKNVRHAEDLCCFNGGTAVERESLGIIGVIAGGRAVERVALEKRRVVNEVKLHAGLLAAIEHRAEAILVIERDGYAAQDSTRLGQIGLLVFREINGDFMSEGGHGARQRSDNVREATSFGERNALRRRKRDSHSEGPPRQSWPHPKQRSARVLHNEKQDAARKQASLNAPAKHGQTRTAGR